MREARLDDEAELARLLGEASELKAAVQRDGQALFESWGVAVAGTAASARAEEQPGLSFVKVTQRPADARQMPKKRLRR